MIFLVWEYKQLWRILHIVLKTIPINPKLSQRKFDLATIILSCSLSFYLPPWRSVGAGPCCGSGGGMETELLEWLVQGWLDWHHEMEDPACLESGLTEGKQSTGLDHKKKKSFENSLSAQWETFSEKLSGEMNIIHLDSYLATLKTHHVIHTIFIVGRPATDWHLGACMEVSTFVMFLCSLSLVFP